MSVNLEKSRGVLYTPRGINGEIDGDGFNMYDENDHNIEPASNRSFGGFGTASGAFSPVPLSPFDKIKLETDRRTAHGHPVILPTKYGEYGPVYDIFALFQNSVKKQLLTAYNTVEGLLRYKYAVSKAEVSLFFEWFDTFSDIVLSFLSIEEDELYPYLEQNGIILPLELSKIQRMKSKDEMAKSLQHLDKQRDMFRLLPPGEIVPRITKLIPEFLQYLVDYFDIQSTNLPVCIQQGNLDDLDASKASTLRSNVMKNLKSRPNYSMHVCFMSRFLRGTKLKAWKNDYLSTIDRFRYEQWLKKFIDNFQSLPSKLIDSLMAETAAGDSDGSNSNLSFYLNRKKNMYKV